MISLSKGLRINTVRSKTGMNIRLFIAFIWITTLVGCEKKSEAEISPKSPSLSNDELLQLMGGELFEVIVPSNIDPEQFAGLAIRYSDGSIDTMSSSNSWTPGQIVKIVCFAAEKNEFRYAYFREGASGSGLTTNFPITEQSSPNGKRSGLKAGEQLMRYSTDNSMTVSGHPQGDDFDVIFHVQEKKKANKS